MIKSNDKKNRNPKGVTFLLLGVFTTTIYFHTTAEDPFNTPKLIILLITAGWLAGHILNYFRDNSWKFNNNEALLVFMIISFLSSMIFSLMNSDNFIIGLIGDNQRRNGLLSYIALSIIILFGSLRITQSQSFKIIKLFLLTGVVLSLYGIIQYSGNDFATWDNPYNRIILTVGNPNFASALLALITIVSILTLSVKSVSLFYRAISLLVAAVSIFCIIQSESRQGLLVIYFGILFYSIVLIYANYSKLRPVILITGIFLFVLVAFGTLDKGPLGTLLYKDSVSVRGFYWEAAVRMFQNFPLTGVGLDNYGSYFKEFRSSEYVTRYGYNITSTNAHNTFLQFFSTGGVLVGLSYLGLLTLILTAGLKLVSQSRDENRKFALIFLSAWVGFQSQSLISIDNIGVSIWGWLLGGVILGLYFEKAREIKGIQTSLKNDRSDSVRLFQPFVSAFILIPIAIVSFFLHNSEKHTYNVRALSTATDQVGKSEALKYAQSVISNPLSDPTNKFKVSDAIFRLGFVKEGLEQMKLLATEGKRDLLVLWWLAEYANSKSETVSTLSYLDQITILDPWNAEAYLAKGRVYKILKDNLASAQMLEKILIIAPESEISKIAQIELN
jgi:O-antigen ligase